MFELLFSFFLVSKIKEGIQKPKANPAPKNAKGAQGKANPAQFKAKPVSTKAKSPAKKLISPLKVKSSVQESSPVEKTDVSKAKKVQKISNKGEKSPRKKLEKAKLSLEDSSVSKEPKVIKFSKKESDGFSYISTCPFCDFHGKTQYNSKLDRHVARHFEKKSGQVVKVTKNVEEFNRLQEKVENDLNLGKDAYEKVRNLRKSGELKVKTVVDFLFLKNGNKELSYTEYLRKPYHSSPFFKP